MSTKPTSTPEPPAQRVHALSAKITQAGKLTPGLRKELREVAIDTADYLRARIADIERRNKQSKSAVELARVQKEISALSAAEKGEPEYLRLAALERMASDLAAKVEAEQSRADVSDDLLQEEIAGFQQQLVVALSIEPLRSILAKACDAVRPFCNEQAPEPFARQLPAVQAASGPFSRVYVVQRSGVQNAEALISLIEQTVSE